jgi:hypothetical protein
MMPRRKHLQPRDQIVADLLALKNELDRKTLNTTGPLAEVAMKVNAALYGGGKPPTKEQAFELWLDQFWPTWAKESGSTRWLDLRAAFYAGWEAAE